MSALISVRATVRSVLYTPHGVDTCSPSGNKLHLYVGEGIRGDRHSGVTRNADVRQAVVPKGIEILNTRQVTVTSFEESQQVAAELQELVEPDVIVDGHKPQSNIVLGDVVGLPPGRTLADIPIGVLMTVDNQTTVLMLTGENQPCSVVAKRVTQNMGSRDANKIQVRFNEVAARRRGITAMVWAGGVIGPNYKVRIEFEAHLLRPLEELETW